MLTKWYIYMALKCNPQTTESTMEIFVIFLVLSFGFGALAGGERKSKYCISFFIHLIHVVCVCVVCGGGGGVFRNAE